MQKNYMQRACEIVTESGWRKTLEVNVKFEEIYTYRKIPIDFYLS
jgi:hypothetical protein